MKFRFLPAVFILLFMSACNGTFSVGLENSPTVPVSQVPVVTETLAPSNPVPPTNTQPEATATLAPSNTPVPAATASLAPSNTPVPLATNTAGPNPILPNYIDDRSTPSQVIVSLYNAINRKEYLRAYNYWNNPSSTQGSFAAFANGYQNTASVSLVFGQITGDARCRAILFHRPGHFKSHSQGWHACQLCRLLYRAPGSAGKLRRTSLCSHGH